MKLSRLKLTLIGAMVGVLLLTGIALAAGESLPRHAVSGGGDTVSAGNITLRNTIGQPIAGSVSNGGSLCSGFICGQAASAPTSGGDKFVYLPLVLK